VGFRRCYGGGIRPLVDRENPQSFDHIAGLM
jgi:hypothetical protein